MSKHMWVFLGHSKITVIQMMAKHQHMAEVPSPAKNRTEPGKDVGNSN